MLVDLSQFWSVGGLAVLVGVILQVLKSGPLGGGARKTLLPYAAMGLGIILAVVIGWALGQVRTGPNVVAAVVGGILSGLTAAGLYDATVNQIKKVV